METLWAVHFDDYIFRLVTECIILVHFLKFRIIFYNCFKFKLLLQNYLDVLIIIQNSIDTWQTVLINAIFKNKNNGNFYLQI